MIRRSLAICSLATGLCLTPAWAGLEQQLGRNDTRIWSGVYRLESGMSIRASGLPERLHALGYVRVHQRPTTPGTFFWGRERFWIDRRAHERLGRSYADQLIGLRLAADGDRVVRLLDAAGHPLAWTAADGLWLEPELLAESLDPHQSAPERISLDSLPEYAWRAVLAAEDHRYFEHGGLDARGLARALLANALAGHVVQGGSTITQQLVKMRDLSPRRTVGRKVSEAVRALALEADYDKREILQAYLNEAYFGHVGGLSIKGLGTAAGAWFGRSASRLDLAQAAALAAMLQAPNRLAPDRHPDALVRRQSWVLGRMRQLGWASPEAVRRAREEGLSTVHERAIPPRVTPTLLAAIRSAVESEAPQRLRDGRGVVVETDLDPLLQTWAEEAVRTGLAGLRRGPGRSAELMAALVALDARDGSVLAYVGGDPARLRDTYDRAGRSRRQPGSSIKPLLLLEAFESCGGREPVYPARRVLDGPIEIPVPGGVWAPRNYGRRYRGVVDIRQALLASLNTPFVRVAKYCGFDNEAERVRRAGYPLPKPAAPSFVLGAVEVSPLELAGAYTAFVRGGVVVAPRLLIRVARPAGLPIERTNIEDRRVVSASTAYLIHDLLVDSVARGIAHRAAIEGAVAWGKTGTSAHDAWFAGGARSVVSAVWVGRDDGEPTDLTGGSAAAPIWRAFMQRAAAARPDQPLKRPRDVVEARVQEATGLRVDHRRVGTQQDMFRREAMPPHRRWWRRDRPVPVIR